MARVISEVPIEEKRVLCRSCGRTIGYYPIEIQRYDGTDMSGGPDGCKFIICPCCGKRIVLESW